MVPMMASWFGACLRSEHLLPRHVGVLVLISVIFSYYGMCVCNRPPLKVALFTTIFKSQAALTNTMLKKKKRTWDPTDNIGIYLS